MQLLHRYCDKTQSHLEVPLGGRGIASGSETFAQRADALFQIAVRVWCRVFLPASVGMCAFLLLCLCVLLWCVCVRV